jgi:chemotaxis protein methyltransferase CheR
MAQVVELVRAATGLIFPDARVADVEATIQRAVVRHGVPSAVQLVPLLRRDVRAREALVAELTIGETYFQRDPAQLELLQHDVLPRLLAARPAGRPVRVWSAGCASGEEPYSVAMLFDEAHALDRCEIIGTDIARRRLEDAQRAVYSRWSLRNTPDDVRQRYFRQRGRYFELVPRIREHVDFRYLNLAEDRFPSLSIGVWGMDVILCRNVLIYFDQDTVREVARRLIASLSEDGWLILGASDPPIAELVECDVELTPAGLVYRRPGAAGAAAVRRVRTSILEPTPAQPHDDDSPAQADRLDADAQQALFDALGDFAAASPDAPAAPDDLPRDDDLAARVAAAYEARDFDAVVALASGAATAELEAPVWVGWIRALANQGALEEAGRIAARALAAAGPTPELLYLHGVLLLQAGRVADAAAALRRALYLDRGFIVAHVTLADAQQREGGTDQARRSLRNASTLLAALPDDAVVRGSDGELAGRMRELVRVKLRLLSEAA